ncbi:MAG: class I SAM-dependent methyltransferase [Candidatus Electryonea clarkiae]|nr:class I SAM-dependent methyltransferase [Candidatus Electryonea clarkiae]MDP8285174.1 class I SAM-dependent methyltransferase [Candidatus Electryonea clarkiae]
MTDEALGYVCPPSVIRWLNSPIRKLIQNPRRIMGKYVKQGDSVVDIGCGGGYFSVALAEMVGADGKIIAVDLQEEMLNITKEFASKRDVLKRIKLHKCDNVDLKLSGEKADFVLAFYMVHEVPDRKSFFKQVSNLLKPDALFMMIEPMHHVNQAQFDLILEEAKLTGLKLLKPFRLVMSRGMIFKMVTKNNN